jgi:anthranilate synthase
MKQMQTHRYRTAGGIDIFRASMGLDGQQILTALQAELDTSPGMLLSSACDHPGRYSRWDIGFSAPPLQISSHGLHMACKALNSRGELLLQLLAGFFKTDNDIAELRQASDLLELVLVDPVPVHYEEERTRRRSVFTVLRKLIGLFASSEDHFLGLHGAFAYELVFQLEDIQRRLPREPGDRELLLYLPDSILVLDHQREVAQQHFYDFGFTVDGNYLSTRNLPRKVQGENFRFHRRQILDTAVLCDHAPGEYAATVRKALEKFHTGDLFEVVPGQTFSMPCQDSPAAIFRRLQQQNPAPYGALINLGEQEFLVAASPEMFVRVEGDQVETCPISGTIARGTDAMEDAANIRTLLNSAKDETELTMCTDVDRNDKSRVCVPGSVQLQSRRHIEMYSRLMHTVDHVSGVLKPGMDAIDAFLAHAWAVTVTGAPKLAAMQFIEDHEKSPRRWYGGAIGYLAFDGALNSGLVIRTISIRDGMANIRAGATLLSDSDPQAEEAETRLKASTLLAVLQPLLTSIAPVLPLESQPGFGLQILMVDHQDSFVHMLSACLQQAGASVRTVRPESVASALQACATDLVVLSPGPGRPEDFKMTETIRQALAAQIPVFGVCLGLQGIVEYFGGSLRQLDAPMHGKQSALHQLQGFLFKGISKGARVGRYHSLVADGLPDCLQVCARSDDGEVMALSHRS